jgi:hypothetical protein
LPPEALEDIKKMQEEGLKKKEEEGWGWLDTLELVPVIGSIVGAVREGIKGNWGMMALNIGFLALDIAGVVSFGASTAASTVAKAAIKTGVKVAAKTAAKQAGKSGLKTGVKLSTKGAGKAFKSEMKGIVAQVAKGKKSVTCKPNYFLLKGEGKVGTYKELIKKGSRGDNLTPHHIPSDKYMKNHAGKSYSRGKGITMNMEQPHPGAGGRHRMTKTYDNNMNNDEWGKYMNKSPRDALTQDIRDARKIYKEQGLYNEQIRSGLQEVIKQNKTQYPTLFKK